MSTPGASVDLMVEACFKAAVFPRLNAIPTILSIEKIVKAIAQVSTSLKTRMWVGIHVCLALVLKETEMRHVANNPTLDCKRDGKTAVHAPLHHSLENRHRGQTAHQRAQGNMGQVPSPGSRYFP